MAFTLTDSAGADVISELGITPLVGVTLALLALFIVTSPLVSNAATSNPPRTALHAPPPQRRTVAVSIDEDGQIAIDRTPVELGALEAQLKQLKAGSDEISVQLNADEGVNYGIVAKALSSIERGGIERLSVVTASD